MKAPERLGILVGGGPAPGINSAIGAATIEARNSGIEVLGIYDGFEHLVAGRTDMVRPLSIADVSRIHFQGGSILRTSRTNITDNREDLERTVATLREMGCTGLILIGGDGTCNAGRELVQAAQGYIRIVQIPKTIDNDLALPGGMPSFGFETARHVGTELVLNLMEDSRSTNRWYFVVVMGRTAGHLALAIGKAAGATLTIIPEEFPESHVTVNQVCRVLAGAILKRRAMGRRDGLAVIAEGISGKLKAKEVSKLSGKGLAPSRGRSPRLSEIPLASMLQRETERCFAAWGDSISVVDVTLGYDLRSAPPIPYDIDYTRTLGYGAARFLISEQEDDRLARGGLIYLQEGHLRMLPFEDMVDPVSGRTKIRLVDTHSEHYTVSREYMIRLERSDLEDPEFSENLARPVNLTHRELGELVGPEIELSQQQASI